MRTELLSRYAQTEAAAQLRWELAQEAHKRGHLRQAMYYAEGILQHGAHSSVAPQAGFWLGEWAQQLGQKERARAAYMQVVTRYPDSYYAWRSAVRLDWPVGDFQGLLQVQPEVRTQRATFSFWSGSPTLQELYHLGEYQDAWEQWQLEFQQRQQPTLADQLTDGLIRVGCDRQSELLRAALAHLGIPVVGECRRQEAWHCTERHLGLIPPAERGDLHKWRERLTALGRA